MVQLQKPKHNIRGLLSEKRDAGGGARGKKIQISETGNKSSMLPPGPPQIVQY